MSLMLLSLCFVTIFQVTSSQSTYDVIQQDNDVNSCPRTEQAMCQLGTGMSQLQETNSQLVTAVSQLQTGMSQLENANSQLATAVSQLQNTSSQLVTAVAQLQTSMAQLEAANSQLQKDVAELKTGKQHKAVKGMCRPF